MATIQKGQKVSFLYSSYLDSGKCVDQETPDPVRMIAGATHKANGFVNVVSNMLIGMTVNQTKQQNVPAKFAFGDRDETKVFRVPAEGTMTIGDEIEIEVNGASQGEILDGTVVKIDEGFALIDTNHPLAGQNLLVKVKVISFN